MNEPTQQVADSSLLVTLTAKDLRDLVRAEVQALKPSQEATDRLLNIDEASQFLGVSSDWLYRNHKKFPFTRKLAPKMLRFSYQGLMKWLASRKPSNNC
jgi:predicted DNA-binding transcriptional regulator AlpA